MAAAKPKRKTEITYIPEMNVLSIFQRAPKAFPSTTQLSHVYLSLFYLSQINKCPSEYESVLINELEVPRLLVCFL